jgi:penicillin-binding protein 1A
LPACKPANPVTWNNKEGATLARNFVLKRMKEQRLISGEEYKEQVGLPLYAMKRTNPFKVSYAIDYIRQQAVSALGYRRAMNGGSTSTGLDSKLQRRRNLLFARFFQVRANLAMIM